MNWAEYIPIFIGSGVVVAVQGAFYHALSGRISTLSDRVNDVRDRLVAHEDTCRQHRDDVLQRLTRLEGTK